MTTNADRIGNLIAALRYRLCETVYRADYATSMQNRRALYAEAYGYARAIKDAYTAFGVDKEGWPFREPRVDGLGRLPGGAETHARAWLKLDADWLLGNEEGDHGDDRQERE